MLLAQHLAQGGTTYGSSLEHDLCRNTNGIPEKLTTTVQSPTASCGMPCGTKPHPAGTYSPTPTSSTAGTVEVTIPPRPGPRRQAQHRTNEAEANG